MDQLDVGASAALSERHLERFEHQVGAHVGRELPANDLAAEGVDHEGEEDEPFPAAQVRDVGDPELVRARRQEVPLDKIGRPPRACRSRLVVRQGLPRRFAPWMPFERISRWMRQRGACSPERRSA